MKEFMKSYAIFYCAAAQIFSILVRQQQFFQNKCVKSNSRYWLQVFILARQLLISFNCQQQLSWGHHPHLHYHCSWFLPFASLKVPRSSSNYAWPELFFNLKMWMWGKLYEDTWAKRGQHFQKLEKHCSSEFLPLVWVCKFHHQSDVDAAVLRLICPNPFMNLHSCA